MAGVDSTERQHRGPNHSSTRTCAEHQVTRGWSLPHQTASQVQAVQRCQRDSPTHHRERNSKRSCKLWLLMYETVWHGERQEKQNQVYCSHCWQVNNPAFSGTSVMTLSQRISRRKFLKFEDLTENRSENHSVLQVLSQGAAKIRECKFFFAHVGGLAAFFSHSSFHTKWLFQKSQLSLQVSGHDAYELLKMFQHIIMDHPNEFLNPAQTPSTDLQATAQSTKLKSCEFYFLCIFLCILQKAT